jgi:hypothetical protein
MYLSSSALKVALTNGQAYLFVVQQTSAINGDDVELKATGLLSSAAYTTAAALPLKATLLGVRESISSAGNKIGSESAKRVVYRVKRVTLPSSLPDAP